MAETIEASDKRAQAGRGLIHRIETANKAYESCGKEAYQEEVEPKRPYLHLYTCVRAVERRRIKKR